MDKEIICSNCGAKLNDGDIFCPECGQKVEANEPNVSEDEKIESGLPEDDDIAIENNIIEEKSDKRKISRKNIVILISIIIIAVIIAVGVKVYLNMPAVKYKSALKNYDSKNYTEAAQIFKELGNYEKSKEYLKYSSIEILRNYVTENGENASYKNAKKKCIMKNINKNEADFGDVSFNVGLTTGYNDGVEFIYKLDDIDEVDSELYLNIPKENYKVKFSASCSLTLSVYGFYASTYEEVDGTVDLSDCDKNYKLSSSDYSYSGSRFNNYKVEEIKESEAVLPSVMDTNYKRLISEIPELLKSTNTGVTMSDLGFKTA